MRARNSAGGPFADGRSALARTSTEGPSSTRPPWEAGSWWHSIDLGHGQVTPGAHSLEELNGIYARFNLPDDLSGKRFLDVGCWDGFYSFEAERHGAEVVAVDCWRPENFFIARRALQSKVEFREMSVYELSREALGSFDIVLFHGVLYHLRHPHARTRVRLRGDGRARHHRVARCR